MGELARTQPASRQPNHPVIQFRYGFSELVVRWIDQLVPREEPFHSRQVIGTDQQLARPIRLRSPATGDRRQRVVSIPVGYHLELRPIVAASAALPYTRNEPVREGRIITRGEYGSNLSLDIAKIVEAVRSAPLIGYSEAALLIWHCASPFVSARLL